MPTLYEAIAKAPRSKRCKQCQTIGYFITDLRGRCMRCKGTQFETLIGTHHPKTILWDGVAYHGTTHIDLQVHDRRHATMVSCPIVWDGSQYVASFPSIDHAGAGGLSLGPVFEFENVEKLIRREVNREGIE